MSNYKNFVEDFPGRCERLLRAAGPIAERCGLEVTLLLMVASTALVVPYERLKPKDKYIRAIEDRTRYEVAAKELADLLGKPFLGSVLWNVGRVASWASDHLSTVSGQPDEWDELRNPLPLSPAETVGTVLTIIRNALAHGNLYTKANIRGTITQLVFVAGRAVPDKIISPFRFVQVSPQDFRTLLRNWVSFLKGFEMSHGILEGVLDEAA
jgi:hypothetical protein